HLHRSYGAAGVLTSAATVALAISAPWRGRRLDQVGLRRALTPSLVVLAACWGVAPFVGFWPLLVLVSIASLFVVPSFSIVRQAMIHAVPETRRTSALSIDAVAIEISFMIGPALGVLLATVWSTQWALFASEFASIGGGLLIWLANPVLRSEQAEAEARENSSRSDRSWLTPSVVAVLLASLATTVVLTGTDVGIVAALRDMDHQSWIGWELAVWGFGSAIGGVIYGALHRSLPVVVLLSLLAVTTMPVGLAQEPVMLAALLFVTGIFCAPTLTATVDALSRVIPERVRGEALGWHGSALTAGGAIGAPIAGVAIDHWGWPAGFVVCGAIGLAAAAGLVATSRRAGEKADSEDLETAAPAAR
ncbi:MAG TPA: MFS transporter, partial [Jatrophihabitantaceae bacterium]|nr:MFS transporter [Jatrophihabitantaceae bacterium]